MLPGVAETIVRAVEGVHPDLHGLMYSNVLLTGASMRRHLPAVKSNCLLSSLLRN